MKNPKINDWLTDSVTITGLTVATVYLLPRLSALLGMDLFHPALPLFWVRWLTAQLLPYLIVGSLLGLAAGWLIRHRRLSLALLPPVLVGVIYLLYLTFAAEPYPWGNVLWVDLLIAGDGLLMLVAAFVCARLVLRRRQSAAREPMLNPNPT